MSVPTKKFMPLPLWLYCVGIAFFAYLFVEILKFSPASSGNLIVSGMYFINFGVHEASHLVVFFLPQVLVAAAGSLGEIMFALLLVIATLKERSYFASVFAGLWVMLSCISAGLYMADARAQQLPLMGPGEVVQHDWHYVFTQLGWLDADVAIGTSVRVLGITIGVLGLLFGAYLVGQKIAHRSAATSGEAAA